MKRVMLLVGKPSAGKTTAIKNLLCRKLLQVVLRRSDIRLVVKINDKIVGFDSSGDPGKGSRLPKDQIEFFKKEKCDICITASRGKKDSPQDKIWREVEEDLGSGNVKKFIIEGDDRVSVEQENEMFATLERWLKE